MMALVTISILLLYYLLLFLYYGLAKREVKDMEAEFHSEYINTRKTQRCSYHII